MPPHPGSQDVQHFKEHLERLAQEQPHIAMLLHWYRGRIEVETIDNVLKEKIATEAFLDLFPELEEDKRYILG